MTSDMTIETTHLRKSLSGALLRILAGCLATVLAAALASGAALAATTGVTVSTLNMRSGPGTGYPVLRVLPAGAQVTLTGCTADAGWCSTTFGGATGWVAASYVQVSYQGQPHGVTPGTVAMIGLGVIAFDVLLHDPHHADPYHGDPHQGAPLPYGDPHGPRGMPQDGHGPGNDAYRTARPVCGHPPCASDGAPPQ